MLELRIKHGRKQLAPHDLRSILGARRAYQEIGHQVDFMIALLDEMAGDPDLEETGDDELSGDDMGDQSWPESPTRASVMSGNGISYREDDEDDDPKEDDDSDYCLAGEDRIVSGSVADPDMKSPAQYIGEDDDAEHSLQRAYTGPLELSAGRQAANDA